MKEKTKKRVHSVLGYHAIGSLTKSDNCENSQRKKMNGNKQTSTFQKKIRNLITIFILLLSISTASSAPMKIWNTVFYDNYPASTQVQWAQQMHADVILIPEDVITTSMITQFKNAGFSVWLGCDPVLNHDSGQTFDITNPTIRSQRIQYVKDLVNALPGISGIQYEELQSSGSGNIAAMNDFLTQTTNFLRTKGMFVTFNIAQMNPPFTNLGFDLTYIDSQRLVDSVFLQIGDRGLSASKDAYSQWSGYMPNTLIVPYVYGWTGSQPTTTELFTVIDYFNTRGMPISITQTDMNSVALSNYPELNKLNPNYVLSSSDTIASVIGRIPISGVVVAPTPTRTPTPIPTPTPASLPAQALTPTSTPTSTTPPVSGTSTITITTNPAHADIWIDSSNANTGYTPNKLVLTPGTHNIRLVLPDYPDIIDTITIASGQSITSEYQFTTLVPAPALIPIPALTPIPTPTPTPIPQHEGYNRYWNRRLHQ